MIKQKYNYGFFYDTYKYRCQGMFKKYYNKLKKQYRYFIIAQKDINECKSDVYRSNLDIDQIIDKLKNTEYTVATIHDEWASFPDVTKYEYIGVCNQVIRIYEDNQSITKRHWYNGLIYMYWTDYGKNTMSARLDNRCVQVAYNSYRITSCFDREDIIVHKSAPLSEGVHMKYMSEHRDLVEKVLNKLMRANVRGFYDELILSIKNEFGVR